MKIATTKDIRNYILNNPDIDLDRLSILSGVSSELIDNVVNGVETDLAPSLIQRLNAGLASMLGLSV